MQTRDAPSSLERLLATRPVTRAEFGLERIDHLLEALGRPERSFDVLHIGGTNGKGSTATAAYEVLTAMGVRAGLYTSPHLISFTERIRIDRIEAPERALDSAADRLLEPSDECGASYFEVATALAVLCFAEAGVQIAVMETGLGGRLDATSALRPVVCGITSISRDHTELLGETLEEIAAEKAGILKPGVPSVLGPVPKEAAGAVEERARALGCPLRRIGREIEVTGVRVGPNGTSFTYRSHAHPQGLPLRSGLIGVHQAHNAAVAAGMLEELAVPPDERALRAGLSRAVLPGRFQILQVGEGWWIFDIAHNPAGVEALGETLGSVGPPPPIIALVSVLRDKAWPAMLRGVGEWAEVIVLTVAPSAPEPRRWDPESVTRAVDLPTVERHLDFDRALARSRELAGGGTVVVTGSTHTVGDALLRLRVD